MNSIGRSVGRQHADFQRAQRPPGVAVADLGQKVERVVVHPHVVLAQPALAVGQRAANERFDVVDRQRLELENAGCG